MPLHNKTKELLRRLKSKQSKPVSKKSHKSKSDNNLIDSIYNSVAETKSPTTSTFSQKKITGKQQCIACSGTGKSSKGKECYPCNGTGKEGERLKTL